MDNRLEQAEEINSNLNRVTRAVAEESSYWKVLTVGLIGAFVSLIFSYFFYQFIASNTAGNFVLVLVSLLTFMMIFILQSILISEKTTLLSITSGEVVLLWVIFVWQNFMIGLVGFFLTLMVMTSASYLAWRNVQNNLKIRFFQAGRAAATKFSTALSVFMAIAYIIVAMTGSTSFVSKDVFTNILIGGSGIIKSFYPDFSFDNSLRENVRLVALEQINRDSRLSSLSVEEKNLFVNKTILNYEESASNLFGVPVDPQSKLSDALFNVVTIKVNELFSLYGVVTYFIIVILVAIILRSIAPIVYWSVLILGFLVYQLILSLNFAHIELESRSKEVAVMK